MKRATRDWDLLERSIELSSGHWCKMEYIIWLFFFFLIEIIVFRKSIWSERGCPSPKAAHCIAAVQSSSGCLPACCVRQCSKKVQICGGKKRMIKESHEFLTDKLKVYNLSASLIIFLVRWSSIPQGVQKIQESYIWNKSCLKQLRNMTLCGIRNREELGMSVSLSYSGRDVTEMAHTSLARSERWRM